MGKSEIPRGGEGDRNPSHEKIDQLLRNPTGKPGKRGAEGEAAVGLKGDGGHCRVAR